MSHQSFDVAVIGAGAAGMMTAITAARRGRRVVVLDHSKKLGTKIRISGGGRCNFTNLYASPQNYLSENPHFCKSALKQYPQTAFIDWVRENAIPFHEKKLGQLFCDRSAQDIVDMLFGTANKAGVTVANPVSVNAINAHASGFELRTDKGAVICESLVIATGGLSIPKSGATDFGYRIARQFELPLVSTRAGLVPFTYEGSLKARCKALSGVSVDATVTSGAGNFREGLLFTHRGLSGPSILQISSYWREKQDVLVNLMPDTDATDWLLGMKRTTPRRSLKAVLSESLPNRLVDMLTSEFIRDGRLADMSDKALRSAGLFLNGWCTRPSGTEGYRTAEVTMGGVSTSALSSKTMGVKSVPGLFFVGEVVDVTGHLGGYNFQWAWSSGYVAGCAA